MARWMSMKELMDELLGELAEQRLFRPDGARSRFYAQERPTREATQEEERQVDDFLGSHERIRSMCEIEPYIRILLLEATMCVEENRWHHYERLKRAGMPFVGWDACVPELCTSAAYNAYIDALDAMLPQESWEEAS